MRPHCYEACRGWFQVDDLAAQSEMVKAVQGSWMNADCPSERYVVTGQNVTRMDYQGSRHFTLQWDNERQQLQWGTQGRLSLTWLGEGQLCWVPSRQHAKAWRWQRIGDWPMSRPSQQQWHQSALSTWNDMPPSGGVWPRYNSGFGFKGGSRSQPYGGRYRGDWSSGSRRGYGRSSGSTAAQARLPCGLMAFEVCDLLFRDITPDDYETLLRLDDTVARPTACPDNIETLPTTSGEELCGQDCVVCLAAFQADDVVTTLPCRHHFHRGCVAKWLAECRNSCPLCGGDVFPEKSKESMQREASPSPV